MQKIYIGTAGWSYKDWEGIVYPAQLKKTQHPVEYLAQYFDLIEINTSFYGHIRPEWGKLWCRKAAAVNPDFVFTAKLNKAFTHAVAAVVQGTSAATIHANAEDEALAKAGLDSVAEEGMLGALLIQFPISFKNTNENREHLEDLLQRFRQYPQAVEVRHSSWNNEGILRYFAEKGVAFCNIDQPKLGKSLAPTEHVTAPLAYVRLHGRNYDQWFQSDDRDDRYNYLYTPEEVERWSGRVRNVAEKGREDLRSHQQPLQGEGGGECAGAEEPADRKESKSPGDAREGVSATRKHCGVADRVEKSAQGTKKPPGQLGRLLLQGRIVPTEG